jgi:hypothetical protein
VYARFQGAGCEVRDRAAARWPVLEGQASASQTQDFRLAAGQNPYQLIVKVIGVVAHVVVDSLFVDLTRSIDVFS